MKTKLRRIGNGYGVILPKQIIEYLQIEEGNELTLRKTITGIELSPFGADVSTQLGAFRRTETRHRNSYRQLSK